MQGILLQRAGRFLRSLFSLIGGLTVLFVLFFLLIGTGLGSYSTRSTPGPRSVESPLSVSSFDLQEFFSPRKQLSPINESVPSAAASEGALTQRKLVKNGALSILVKAAEEAAREIQSIATRLGGFPADVRVFETAPGTKAGTLTIRVPAERFDEAMAEVKKVAVEVESESVSAKDVTEQYVDLEAQLRNLRAEEAQYLELMKRALIMNDILSVSAKLSDARGRIERIQGQLQYLSRQVDMSTITVNLIAEADVKVFGIRWHPLFVAKQAFREMLSGLTNYINTAVWFVLYLPVLLLWLASFAVLAVIGWRLFRWLKARFLSSPLS
ncbi:MAG: DUF4349 domain-containing protein [bacterium]|nr:DUF4349 domain-containing protein [bacterium]